MAKDKKYYYVYEWFNVDTGEVFYVGKGCRNRYKSKSNRNQLFIRYCNNNNVDVRIVKYFDVEEDAYDFEDKLIDYYWSINQCQCCMQKGGYGGYSNVWTQAAKDYQSEFNPMKQEQQRQRMSENNPMKNKDVAMLNGAKHKRKVCVGDVVFDGLVDVSRHYSVSLTTVDSWIKRGFTSDYNECHYFGTSLTDDQVNNLKLAINNDKKYVVDFYKIDKNTRSIVKKYSDIRDAAEENDIGPCFIDYCLEHKHHMRSIYGYYYVYCDEYDSTILNNKYTPDKVAT